MATLRNGDLIAVGAKPHEFYQFKDEPDSFICEKFDAKYAITRLLGKGAFGEVYLAISKVLLTRSDKSDLINFFPLVFQKCTQRFAVKKIQVTGRDESKIANEVKIMEKLKHVSRPFCFV